MTTGKTIALTIQTFVDKAMPLLFNMLSRLAISLHMQRHILKYLSHVRLSATPWTVARQAPLSVGLSRQEYWSGLQFPSPGESSPPKD